MSASLKKTAQTTSETTSDLTNVESRNRAIDIHEEPQVCSMFVIVRWTLYSLTHSLFTAILKQSIRHFVDVVEGDAMDMS